MKYTKLSALLLIVFLCIHPLSARTGNEVYNLLLQTPPEFELTEEEQQFIIHNRILRVAADPEWPPFEYFNSQQEIPNYAGINYALLRKAAEKLNLQLNFIPTRNFSESINIFSKGFADIISGQNSQIDMITSLDCSKTISVYRMPLVLVSKNESEPQKGDVIYIPSLLQTEAAALYENYPPQYFEYAVVDDAKTLNRLYKSRKNAFFFLNQYSIPENMNGNIFETGIEYKMRFCISSALPQEALTCLNKALSDITNEEFNSIVYACISEHHFIQNEQKIRKRQIRNFTITFILSIAVISIIIWALLAYVKTRRPMEINYDELTGIPSFVKFKHDVRQRLKKAIPNEYYLLSLDINNFSFINDSYGFAMGNALLMEISQQFYFECQKSDALICRFYADNFLIFAKNPGFIGLIEDFVYRLTNNSEYIKKLLPEQYELTFSSGVYYILNPENDLTVMIDNANSARKNGKEKSLTHRITEYTQQMGDDSELKKSITLHMNKAIENGEFEVYYQPKYRFIDSSIIGAEALIRWNNPEKGFLPPDKFIPLFEHNGFIQKIDLYVFEQVCNFIHNWNHSSKNKDCPHPITISFNLSRFHLYNPNLIKELTAIYNRYQISPCMIEVELTESVMFDNKKRLIKAMNEIKDAGFKISVDDFGSGYSSLNLLKDMPADVLKLDKEFLSSAQAQENEKESIIISSVIDMAKKLNLTTVAEGVETIKQSEQLKKIGCDIVQGYLFSKPVKEDSFRELLASNFL